MAEIIWIWLWLAYNTISICSGNWDKKLSNPLLLAVGVFPRPFQKERLNYEPFSFLRLSIAPPVSLCVCMLKRTYICAYVYMFPQLRQKRHKIKNRRSKWWCWFRNRTDRNIIWLDSLIKKNMMQQQQITITKPYELLNRFGACGAFLYFTVGPNILIGEPEALPLLFQLLLFMVLLIIFASNHDCGN